MKRARRNYDKEFKLMAVELCQTGKPTKEVAGELGVATELVRRWRREHTQYQEGSFSGKGNANMTDDQKENARLRRTLNESQLECEILKKAVGIFSRSDGKSMSL